MSIRAGVLLATAVAIQLSACATVRAPFDTGWIKDGQTTRKEALSRLGEPVRYLESGQILIYRIAVPTADRSVVGSRAEAVTRQPLQSGMWNLVLAFDAKGVLMQHARVDR